MALALSSLVLLALAACGAEGAAVTERRRERPARFGFRRNKDRRALTTAFMTSDLSFDGKTDGDSSKYLLQFRGKGDDYCAYMEPLKERLRKEMGLTIRCFEVWYDSRNLELLQKLDHGRCNGVPFFYNKKTKQFICGATSYDNLKTWATCGIPENFLAPSDLKAPGEEESGVKNKMQEFFATIKARGQAMMDERNKKEGEEEQ